MIISAKEAQERFRAKAYYRALLTNIDSRIKEAVDRGESQVIVYVSDIYYRNVQKELEQLGYQVVWNLVFCYLTISWKY